MRRDPKAIACPTLILRLRFAALRMTRGWVVWALKVDKKQAVTRAIRLPQAEGESKCDVTPRLSLALRSSFDSAQHDVGGW